MEAKQQTKSPIIVAPALGGRDILMLWAKTRVEVELARTTGREGRKARELGDNF
jgi:hypothetical protein